jgi:glycosyltransferase involved in cell wall biosynthesis
MSLRILHYNAVPGWRGGEQQGLYLIQGLTGYPVTQFAAGQPGSPFLERTSPFVSKSFSLESRGELSPAAVFQLVKLVREYRIDIVHTHTTHAHSLALQAKHVYGDFVLVVHRRVDFLIKNNPVSLYKYRSDKVDRIIAISEFIRNLMIEQGIPQAKIDVIHSGVDPKRLHADRALTAQKLRAEYRIDPETVILGNIAALSGHKDHLTLIRSLPLVIEKEPRCLLFILGEGDQREPVQREIERLGLERHVIMPGFRNDLETFIGGFDLYVHSSKDEGLGTSIIDALANGIPVVATDAGGIPEILGSSGEYGIVVPKQQPEALAEGILKLMKDPSLMEHYRHAGMKRAGSFSVDTMVKSTYELYRRLCG